MAKRKTLEEILESDFRWPMQGDMPFVSAENSFDNANIVEDGFHRLVLMTDGYKEAADLMVEKAARDRTTRDTLVFPIIFNYRQFLELSLKYQLATYGASVGVAPVWKTHDLAILWSRFLEMLMRYGTDDPDEAEPIVGEIILGFAKIDPGSYSYRYPVDPKGNPLPVAHNDLHLATLADVMKAVENFFTGCDGFLDNLLKASV